MQPCYPHLFSPIVIRGQLFKNRIISAPLGAWAFSPDNYIFDYARAMFEEKARGGAAAVCVGHTEVNTHMDDTDYFGLYFNLRDREGTAALTEFAHAIQEHGALASIELNYGGIFNPDHKGACYGPSGYIAPNGKVIHELNMAKMNDIIGMYAACAAKMRRTDFRMVTIHGAHGWLPAQFLSTKTNHRADEYGGSLKNRMRFPLQLVKAVREAMGPDMVLEYRISGVDPREDPEGFEEIAAFVGAMEGMVDIIHVSSGEGVIDTGGGGMLHTFPTYLDPRGVNIDVAASLKERVNIPVCVVGAITQPEMAEAIIAGGKADFVGMTRAIIADPEWPNKMRRGLRDDARPCVNCYNCLEVMHGNHFLGCDVNPRSGREARVKPITPTQSPKRVCVVGGGPAGMEAAITAAQCGHEVILFEKSGSLGGLLKISDGNPVKWMLYDFKEYLIRQVLKHKIDLRFDTEAAPELLRSISPDAIIVATGSVPAVPKIPGVDRDNVYSCVDIHKITDPGERIVIVGGNLTGCETALYLASIGKRNVTIVEMTDKTCADANHILGMNIGVHMSQEGVKALVKMKCTAINGDGVSVSSYDGVETFLHADTVILATGMKPTTDVYFSMLDCAPDVIPVGDCVSVGNIRNATRTAYYSVRDL